MKLLNFSNLEFKWEMKKRIICDVFCVELACKFKYWFYYPSSYYFKIDPDIKWIKNCYRKWFIDSFKYLKKDIANETS